MKKLMYSLMVAAVFSAATMASANDLPYEQDHGLPGGDDPVPTEDAVDVGGKAGLTETSDAGDLGGLRILLRDWVVVAMGYIVTLPNRSQING